MALTSQLIRLVINHNEIF